MHESDIYSYQKARSQDYGNFIPYSIVTCKRAEITVEIESFLGSRYRKLLISYFGESRT